MPKTAKTIEHTDELPVRMGVAQGKRAEVCKKLSGLLASTYLLYLKTLYYHWNVTGANFVGLHGLFGEQYEELHQAGDALAERIRALGHFTPGTVGEFVALSTIEDDKQLPASAEEMIRNLLGHNEACSKEARGVMETAEEAEDEVTVDMMVGRMTQHEKTSWMLRSLLE